MATLAQIEAKSTATLTATERNHARTVLGSSKDPSSPGYDTLEAVFDALSAGRNQEARAILSDWDTIPAQPVVKSGGAKGILYETNKHRYQVYADMARTLGLEVRPYSEWVVVFTEAGAQMVTITLGGMYAIEGDEFAG